MQTENYIEKQTGKSSHYAAKFHKRKTASGELFDLFGVTAAHRKLPFGSIVRVINIDNQKTAIVKINDRGPHIRGRIIDLTYRVARDIDAIGLEDVEIEFFNIKKILDELYDDTENYLLGYSFNELIIAEKVIVKEQNKVHNFEGAINILINLNTTFSTNNYYIFTKITQKPKEYIIGTIN